MNLKNLFPSRGSAPRSGSTSGKNAASALFIKARGKESEAEVLDSARPSQDTNGLFVRQASQAQVVDVEVNDVSAAKAAAPESTPLGSIGGMSIRRRNVTTVAAEDVPAQGDTPKAAPNGADTSAGAAAESLQKMFVRKQGASTSSKKAEKAAGGPSSKKRKFTLVAVVLALAAAGVVLLLHPQTSSNVQAPKSVSSAPAVKPRVVPAVAPRVAPASAPTIAPAIAVAARASGPSAASAPGIHLGMPAGSAAVPATPVPQIGASSAPQRTSSMPRPAAPGISVGLPPAAPPLVAASAGHPAVGALPSQGTSTIAPAGVSVNAAAVSSPAAAPASAPGTRKSVSAPVKHASAKKVAAVKRHARPTHKWGHRATHSREWASAFDESLRPKTALTLNAIVHTGGETTVLFSHDGEIVRELNNHATPWGVVEVLDANTVMVGHQRMGVGDAILVH